MVIWVIEIQGSNIKLDIFFDQNQSPQRKLLYFVNSTSGKSSKIEHHFRK